MAFIITQISAYNYTADNKKLSGTIHLREEHSETKMEVKMNAEDVARIFEVFADRISLTVKTASQVILDEVRTVETSAIEPPAPPPHVPSGNDAYTSRGTRIDDDEIPF